ncbi:MAG: hypothetical protein LBC86_06985 [Oscillospiraceae bacterium]|nr:hypothetical protein [Oscillospiraceae bacterium]
MKKKIISIAMAVMMCLSLTMNITAYDSENICDTSCCSSQDVWYIYNDFGSTNFFADIIAAHNCSHPSSSIRETRFTTSQVINSHWVPISGGSGSTVQCFITLHTDWIRLTCIACNTVLTTSILREYTTHSFC